MAARNFFLLLITALVASVTISQAETPEPEKLRLWAERVPVGDGSETDEIPVMTVYRPDRPNGTAMVICPGGGYGGLVTGPEGHGIATWLNRHHITGIVLEYRLPKGRAMVPLLDAQRAIRMARFESAKFKIDPAKIGIIGFSAGGHLASTAGTHFDAGDPSAIDPIDRVSSRPDFMILIYPVITMDETTHSGSRINLLGNDPSAVLIEKFSSQKQVTKKTPATFLAHAADDDLVSPKNSSAFYQALRAHQVPAKYLELPSGGHGLDGYRGPMWEAWQSESLAWLKTMKLVSK